MENRFCININNIIKKTILTAIAVIGIFAFTGFLKPAYGADITEGQFNPITKEIIFDFRFDVTQRTDIEVMVDGKSWGFLLKDFEVKGSEGDLSPMDPSSSSYYESRAVYSQKLDNVEIGEIEKDGKTLLRLKWDGRINGIPVITEDTKKDKSAVLILLKPQGYPERSKPDEYIPDGHGGTIRIPGENWTWTQDPAFIKSTVVYIDYRKMLEGDYKNCFIMVKGGSSFKITCEMPEIFSGNKDLLNDFAAYMNNNGIADVETGDPINMVDGNYTFSYPDLRLEGAIPLTFLRVYSSRDEDGSLGKGFTHGYDYHLLNDDGIIRVTMPYGEEIIFLYTGTGYRPLQNQGFTLDFDGTGYIMTHEYGAKFYFENDGKLKDVKNPDGVLVASMEYDGEHLSKISGIAGEYNLFWDDGKHITRIADSSGREMEYTYEGDNLVNVKNTDGDSIKYKYDANGYIAEATDFVGNVIVQNEYDEIGRVLKQVFTNADVKITAMMEYDDKNKVNTYISSTGLRTRYKYNDHREIISVEEDGLSYDNKYEDDILVKAKDASGSELHYETDDKGRVTKLLRPDGTAIGLKYEKESLIKSVVFPDGSSEDFTYDSSGKLLSKKDRNGNLTSYRYNANGLREKEIDACGGVTSYTYDLKGRITSVTNAEGEVKTFQYNDSGYVTEHRDPMGGICKYKYSKAGKVLETEDQMGYITKYEYDANGFKTKETDANGNSEETEYASNGKVIRKKDKMGNETGYTYDEHGRLSSVTDPMGGVLNYEYDEKTRLKKTVDKDGNATLYEYDDCDRIKKVTNAEGGETEYTYDSMGRMINLKEPGEKVTSYTYDVNGRMESKTEPENTVTRYRYDKNGNLTEEIDPENISKKYTYDARNQVETETDGEGNVTKYGYDRVGRRVSETDPLGNITSYVYDKNGNMLERTDPNGNKKTYTYDAKGRRITESDGEGNTIKYTYDALSNETSVTDQDGNVTRYTYYKNGNKKSMTDPNGNVTTYEYDKNGELISTKNPDGGILRYEYTKGGAVSKMTDPLGNITLYEYDPMGRKKKIKDAEGNITENIYDISGNLIEIYLNSVLKNKTSFDKKGKEIEETDSNGYSKYNWYDKKGNLTSSRDKNANITIYKYDKNGQLIESCDALTNTKKYKIDAGGRIVSETDEEGNVKSYIYDRAGRVVEIKDAEGNITKNEYDKANRVIKITNPMGGYVKFEYNGAGKLIKSTDSNGRYSTYGYDKNGNRISETNRENEKTLYSYDKMNRLVKEINPLNHSRMLAYDFNGNIINETDMNGHKTVYKYDAMNRIKSRLTPEGNLVEILYDVNGKLKEFITDGGGGSRAKSMFRYDMEENLLESISPLGYKKAYEYDGEGNLIRAVDAEGNETIATYDALNRVKTIDKGDEKITVNYNKIGKPIAVISSSAGKVEITYDVLSKITDIKHENGKHTGYAYDKNGRRTKLIYPDGKEVNYVYDVDGRIEAIKDYDGREIKYTKDAEGRIIKRKNADLSSTEYDYNAGGQLVQQKEVTGDGITEREIIYGYDDKGNLKSEHRTGVDIDKKDESVRYYYDGDDRLIKTICEGKIDIFEYDKAGNLKKDGKYTYTYDMQNRLIKKEGAGAKYSYKYDKNGNLIKEEGKDRETTYTYDKTGRLLKGENKDGSYSIYTYGALGARIKNEKHRMNPNYSYRNILFNNGSERIKEYMPALLEKRAKEQSTYETEVGTTVENEWEDIEENYVPDYLSVAQRDLIMDKKGAFVSRYIYDDEGNRLSADFAYALGTERGETDQNGNYGENIASDIAVKGMGQVFYKGNLQRTNIYQNDKHGKNVAHSVYDAWGNSLNFAPTDLNHTGLEKVATYGGYTYDDVLGLYYAQNRFYDPKNYRFTQEDPIKADNNWYAYCDSNPTTYVDPYGLKARGKQRPKTSPIGDKVSMSEIVWDILSKQNIKILPAGFDVKVDADGVYFIGRINGWQKEYGYMDLFDEWMNHLNINNIKPLKVIFDYKKKRWRIECWKGRYGLLQGGEIGVYIYARDVKVVEYFSDPTCVKKKVLGKTITRIPQQREKEQEWFRAANKKEYIGMEIKLYHVNNKGKKENNPFAKRKEKSHWWNTIFKKGIPMGDIVMDYELDFKGDWRMMKSYEDGFYKRIKITRQKAKITWKSAKGDILRATWRGN